MAGKIQGKVAKILDASRLIVNVGRQSGVKEGMLFVILALGDEVVDPDTGESLGEWEVPKGYVRATHVQDRLATCEACKLEEEKKAAAEDPSTHTLSAEMIAVSMLPSAKKTTLNVRRGDISGMPEIGPIQVGDRVRAVPEK